MVFAIMMKFLFLVFCTIITFSACNGPKNETLENAAYDPEKLANLLADIQLVESVKRITANEKDDYIDSVDYYSSVFKKHHVTKEEFEAGMEYFSHRPDELEKVYERVIEVLSEREAGYLGKETTETK
jgi:hypothetical protein